MTKYTAQVPALTTTSYMPFTDGSQAEFKLYRNDAEVGSAMGVTALANGTCSLNVLTQIAGQEEGMSRAYAWTGSELNVVEQSAQGTRTRLALKSSVRVGDTWTTGGETFRVASIGDLETAIGTLHNVLRVDQLSGGNIYCSMWYAENIGMVKLTYQVEGGTDWMTWKITKYTAQPTTISLTAADLFPMNQEARWIFDVKKAGATLGTLTATMSILATGSAQIDSTDTSSGQTTTNSETYDISNGDLRITGVYQNPQTQTWLKFPLRVGSTWSDGDLSWAVVSYGALTLGNTTYENVVRVVRFN
jgi:hypothetical protein